MSETATMNHLRDWIGRRDTASDAITPALLQRFRAVLAGYTELGSALPLGIHWCLALPTPTYAELGIDGHPAKGGFLPPVPLPRRMWASSRIRFHQAARVGAIIERISTITDIVSKQSASAGPLVFVTVDHTFTQETGQGISALLDERQTIVYCRRSRHKQATKCSPAPPATTMSTTPDSTLLFRYSAMTFNAHRIHYDHDYATREEGYPALVVQGPLMATLLMNLAQAHRAERPLREFEFRGIAPAFVDQALVLALSDHEPQALHISNDEDALIMTATSVFE